MIEPEMGEIKSTAADIAEKGLIMRVGDYEKKEFTGTL
jgi:hypothetical protein